MSNVLYIMGDYTQKLALQMHDALKNNSINMECFFYTTRKKGSLPKYPEYVTMYNSTSRLRLSIFYRKRIQNVIKYFQKWIKDRANKYTIMQAHMLMSDGILAYEANRVLGIPYIVAVRNTDLHAPYLTKTTYAVKYREQIIRNASAIVFTNKPYFDKLAEMVSPEIRKELTLKSRIIPNGIDDYWINNMSQKPHAPKSGKIVVLSAGEVNDNKNQLFVAETIRVLRADGLDISYRIAGHISDKSIASKLRTFEATDLLGPLSKEELLTEYRNADLFVLVSKHETFGLCYPEALSQGLPIIYSRGEGFDGYFEDGTVGFGVRNDSSEQLSTAIKKILDRYFEISSRCIDSVAMFSWRSVSAEWKNLYDEVL